MSRWLQIALEAEVKTIAPPYTLQESAECSGASSSDALTDTLQKPAKRTPGLNEHLKAPLSQLSAVCGAGNSNQSTEPSALPADTSDMRHGFSPGGRPLTWTGKVVNLDEWRSLSEWEKHGPDGNRWNALTQQWEKPYDG